ncbi:MAG TPA: lipocalin family protein [Saprospiraceae bacterium]|nr:lipocalin family protein [Saprospiraceae bacterium]HMP25752.1 lipocalin family protein [Saprospiraceae bacterium]
MKVFSKMKHFTLVLLVLTVALASCKKDKNDPDRVDLLVEKQWRTTALTIDPAIDWFGNGTLVTNIYAQLDQCDRDDITIFRKNNTVEFDEGPTKCNPNDPQTVTGTWAFNPDKTILSVTLGGSTTSYIIKEMTDKRILADYEERFLGVTYTLSATFTN